MSGSSVRESLEQRTKVPAPPSSQQTKKRALDAISVEPKSPLAPYLDVYSVGVKAREKGALISLEFRTNRSTRKEWFWLRSAIFLEQCMATLMDDGYNRRVFMFDNDRVPRTFQEIRFERFDGRDRPAVVDEKMMELHVGGEMIYDTAKSEAFFLDAVRQVSPSAALSIEDALKSM